MGYRRETLMLRAPGGGKKGFVVWERDARRGSLRCQLERLEAGREYRLLWLAQGESDLRDGGELRGDSKGAARRTLSFAENAPLAGVAVARPDGALCAYAFLQDAALRETGPERLQAMLEAHFRPRRREAPVQAPEVIEAVETVEAIKGINAVERTERIEKIKRIETREAVVPEEAVKTPEEAKASTREEAASATLTLDARTQDEAGAEGEAWPPALAAYRELGLWWAQGWPPPPGLPGAVRREGYWR